MKLSAIVLCSMVFGACYCDNVVPLPFGGKSKDVAPFGKMTNKESTWPGTCGKHKIEQPFNKDDVGVDIDIKCTLRANILYKTKDNVKIEKNEQCSRVVACKSDGENLNKICEDEKKAKIHDIRSKVVNVDKQATALFANDASCDAELKSENVAEISMRYTAQPPGLAEFRHLDLPSDSNSLDILTRRLPGKDEGDNRPNYLEFLNIEDMNAIQYRSKLNCSYNCMNGDVISYPLLGATWSRVLYLKDSCKWVYICLNAQDEDGTYKCSQTNIVKLQLVNGFAANERQKSAIIIDFNPGGSNKYFVEVARNKNGRIVVTTSAHQRTLLGLDNPDLVAFYFDSHDCLFMPMAGKGNVMCRKGDCKGLPNEMFTGTHEPLPTIPPVVVPSPPTDPPVVDEAATVKPTTTAVPPAANLFQGETKTLESVVSPNRIIGWATWAVFFGFFAGSLVGGALAGVLLFLCRRSIYDNWYRGMYQRYQCDASGTTGGMTGATFGATTGLGGGTTISSTTMGGTTMGGTTSGGTTTGGSPSTIGSTSEGGSTAGNEMTSSGMVTM